MSDFRIESSGIKNGRFDLKYGRHGKCDDKGMAITSPAIKFCDALEGTKSFAIVLEDKDAFGVSGFSWIHWTACNIHSDLEDDASRTRNDFIQGVNSWISIQGGRRNRDEVSCYGGMAPPDKEHFYEIHAYALDCDLPLKKGFLMNELYHAMSGHVLASDTIGGWYY